MSNGHFSDDNQKKLTGKDVGVPIFEAKMTRDTRLVVGRVILPCRSHIKRLFPQYQVDCVREFETEVRPAIS